MFGTGLRSLALALVVGAIGAAALMACSSSEPEVVEKIVEVEKVVEVEKIVEVEKPVEVEKIVEKEVVKTIVKEVQVPAIQSEITEAASFTEYFQNPMNAKYGGTFKWGGRAKPSMYDFHQSPTHNNLTAQQPMYNTVVQFDPRDGGLTIAPDLATAWAVSDDGKEYTFTLRRGVEWHDGPQFECGGGPFTANDVVATYERIIDPPEGMISLRKELMVDGADLREIVAVDDHTVKFVLGSPRTTLVPALASGWNMVVSEKYLDCVNNSMRDSAFIPGTGPFVITAHTPGESWNMEKNVDYFIEHLPYFDNLDLAALAQAQARAAAIYGGQVDAVMQITKEDMQRAWDNPDKFHSQIGNFFNGNIFAFNPNRPPFDDVRVRRAVHLVVDKMTLHELTAKTGFNGEEPGGWFLPDWQTGGSPYSRSGEELAAIPGYRVPTAEDIAEAKRLLAEAGYPDGAGLNISFLQRGNQPSATVAAIQDMIRKNLNVEMEIELTDEGGYYDRVLNKDFDTTGTFTAAEIIDPGPWFTRFLAEDGSWNYGGWSDPRTDALMKKINEEQDIDKRVELVREMQVLLDELVPIMLFNYHGGYDIYRTYLGGPGMTDMYYGGYNSMHRRWTHIWFERDRE